MFVHDNIVIYINVKKDQSTIKCSRDAMKWILGGSLYSGIFDFRFCIWNILFVKWDWNFFIFVKFS